MHFLGAGTATLLLVVTAATAVAQSSQHGGSKPMLSVAPGGSGPSGLVQPDPPILRYATVRAGPDGATHIEQCTLAGFVLKSYAPPAAPQWLGIPPGDIDSLSYGILPVGYVGAWHHSPGPQWVFVLSGRWSVETTDGTVLQQGPGEFQFNAEAGATPQGPQEHVGHLTRQVGDVPNVQLIVSLKKGSTARPATRCAPAAR